MTLASQLQDISRAGEKVSDEARRNLSEVIEEAYQTAIRLRSLFGFDE